MVSGFQVLEWIRTQPALAGLRVVIFSSSARPEDRALAKELGADDYLEKPGSTLKFCSFAELLSKKWLADSYGMNTATMTTQHPGDLRDRPTP